jgi:hypothetical protein
MLQLDFHVEYFGFVSGNDMVTYVYNTQSCMDL